MGMAAVSEPESGEAEFGEADLEDVAALLAGSRNIADARVVDFAGDRLDDGEWAMWGIKSPEHFLCWQFGVTPWRAKTFTTMAKKRHELPLTFDKFRAGMLSTDQVLLICRHCPPDYETSVVEFALNATLPQLAQSLKAYAWPEPAPPNPDLDAKKQASFTTNERGGFTLRVTGNAEEGQRVQQALYQYWARLKETRSDTDSECVSNHEAFMALVDSAADADLSTSRRYRHRTLLHIEANQLVDWANGLVPHLHLGPLVNNETMQLLTCDGAVQLLVTEFGTPVRLGRTSRTVPRWLRELVLDRDNGCRICGATVGLDVHHVVHWANGGATDPSNLVTLCTHHHTQLHNGHFTITGDAQRTPGPGRQDGLTITNDHGHRFRPPQPKPPLDQPAARYKHPLGAPLRQRDVHFCRTEPHAPPAPLHRPQLE